MDTYFPVKLTAHAINPVKDNLPVATVLVLSYNIIYTSHAEE